MNKWTKRSSLKNISKYLLEKLASCGGIVHGSFWIPDVEDDGHLVVAKRLNESDPDLSAIKRVFGIFVHYADCFKLDFQGPINITKHFDLAVVAENSS